jgi:thymidine kinase
MRSSKTSALKQHILSIVLRGDHAVVFRPAGDSQRWNNDEKHPNRVTHDGQGYLPIEQSPEVYKRLTVVETKLLCDQLDYIKTTKLKEVLVDEFQFFNAKGDAFQFLQTMAKEKISVTIAGLTLNWKREMFHNVVECFGLFTHIEHKYARCNKCGEKATFTAKVDKSKTDILQVGDKEYESRCHACFDV